MSEYQSPLMRAGPRGCGWFLVFCLIMAVVFVGWLVGVSELGLMLGLGRVAHEYGLLGGFWLGVLHYGSILLLSALWFGGLWLCAVGLSRRGRRFGLKG